MAESGSIYHPVTCSEARIEFTHAAEVYAKFIQSINSQIGQFITGRKGHQWNFIILHYISIVSSFSLRQQALHQIINIRFKKRKNFTISRSAVMDCYYQLAISSLRQGVAQEVQVFVASRKTSQFQSVQRLEQMTAQFLAIDKQRIVVQSALRECLEKKIKMLKIFFESQTINMDQVASELAAACAQIDATKKQIARLCALNYNEFEYKVQTFFTSEVENNYDQARIISAKILPAHLSYIQYESSSLTLFDREGVARAEIGLAQDGLAMYYHSENMARLFGYSSEEFAQVRQIEQFIPSPVSTHHSAMVRDWLASMECKIFKKIAQLYCEKKNGALFLANSFFDFKLNCTCEDLVVNFFILQVPQPPYLTLIVEGKSEAITAVSENLLKYVFFDKEGNYRYAGEQEAVFQTIKGTPVIQLLPAFAALRPEVARGQRPQAQTFASQLIQLPRVQISESGTWSADKEPQRAKGGRPRAEPLTINRLLSMMRLYRGSVSIQHRPICADRCYYILQLEKLALEESGVAQLQGAPLKAGHATSCDALSGHARKQTDAFPEYSMTPDIEQPIGMEGSIQEQCNLINASIKASRNERYLSAHIQLNSQSNTQEELFQQAPNQPTRCGTGSQELDFSPSKPAKQENGGGACISIQTLTVASRQEDSQVLLRQPPSNLNTVGSHNQLNGSVAHPVQRQVQKYFCAPENESSGANAHTTQNNQAQPGQRNAQTSSSDSIRNQANTKSLNGNARRARQRHQNQLEQAC